MVGRQSCPQILSAEKKGVKVTELEFAYLLSTLPCETGKVAKEVFFSSSVFTQYSHFHVLFSSEVVQMLLILNKGAQTKETSAMTF